MSSESIVPIASPPTEPTSSFPPVAGFWRRFFAWLVDTLVLGLTGMLIGWLWAPLWYQIGPYGRFVGLPIIAIYFGLLNSRVGGGQTLGKRWLKIAVRDRHNKPISVGRSLLRIAILAAPVELSGWPLPILEIPAFAWLLNIIVFGAGGAILYTMVFNRRTRQGLHDLLCETYVVHLPGTPIESFPRTAPVHVAISGTIIGLVMLVTTAFSLFGGALFSASEVAQVRNLYETLKPDSRFFTISVSSPTFYSTHGKVAHLLNIQVWYKGVLTHDQRKKSLTDIARTTLTSIQDVGQYDGLRIAVISRFGLGIASGSFTSGDAQPISVWQERAKTPDAP